MSGRSIFCHVHHEPSIAKESMSGGVVRKIILMLLLAVVSSSAMAEWVVIGDDDKEITYVDTDNVRKAGNKLKAWFLTDNKMSGYKTLDDIPYMSTKSQHEFDCIKEQTRVLYHAYHSKNMAEGEIVKIGTEPNRTWGPVSPDGVERFWWKFACGKK
jgi:hypothetical protein